MALIAFTALTSRQGVAQQPAWAQLGLAARYAAR
jgi:hypothetical protein